MVFVLVFFSGFVLGGLDLVCDFVFGLGLVGFGVGWLVGFVGVVLVMW